MFQIPSLDQCVQRARASFRSYLKGTDAWLWPNNIGPTAKVVGGSVSEVFQRLDFVGQQAFTLFAIGKYLEARGAEYNITRRAASSSGGNLVITATDAIVVANAAQFLRGDGVVVNAPVGGALTGAGTLAVGVIAAVPAQASNSQPGTSFTILSGVSGPGANTATIEADSVGLIGGLDVEPDGLPRTTDLGTLRGRILFRQRNPPQGGAPHDYVQWASEIPGVTRVYVERQYNGPGSVRVFPIFDDLFAATGGIADSAHINLVQQHLATLQPAAAQVTVVAPVATPIAVAISGLVPNTVSVQQAVTTELLDTFQRLGRVSGNDPANDAIQAALPFLATPFSFAAIWVDQAIANATGDKRAVVTAPTADTMIPAGHLPVLSGPTFS